jgi:hypothetical protein
VYLFPPLTYPSFGDPATPPEMAYLEGPQVEGKATVCPLWVFPGSQVCDTIPGWCLAHLDTEADVVH